MIGHKTHSLAHGPTALESSWCVRAWVGDEGATAMHIQQGPLFCSFRIICSSAIARASPNRRSTSQARRGQGSLLRAPNCGGCGVPSLTLQRARRKKSLNSPAPHKVRRRPWRQGSRMVTLDSRFSTSRRSVCPFRGAPRSRLSHPRLQRSRLLHPPLFPTPRRGAIDTPTAAGGRIARGVVPARRGRKPKMWPLFDLPESGLCQAAENAERWELIPVRKKIFGLGF